MNKALVFVLSLLVVGSALGLDKDDFDSVVDFSFTMADIPSIAEALYRGDPIDERFVIIEGTVSGTVTLVSEPEEFQAILFLLTGEWDGVEEVETYDCYVRVIGPEFARRVPPRRPRSPEPNTILVNSTILVAGAVAGLTEDGTVLIDALHVRVTD